MYTLLIKADTEEIKKMYEGHGAIHEGDSGVDLFCPGYELIMGGAKSYKIKLGIKCAMVKPNGDLVSYMLVPRSSMGSKTTLRLSNSVGIIDAGYRGEIMGVVDNVDNYRKHEVAIGDRLFQIVAPDLEPFTIKLVDELPRSDRGTGGFGSTGSGKKDSISEATKNGR